jgi:hypothetical protein
MNCINYITLNAPSTFNIENRYFNANISISYNNNCSDSLVYIKQLITTQWLNIYNGTLNSDNSTLSIDAINFVDGYYLFQVNLMFNSSVFYNVTKNIYFKKDQVNNKFK